MATVQPETEAWDQSLRHSTLMALMRGGLGFQNIMPCIFLPNGLSYYTPTKNIISNSRISEMY